MKFEQLLKEIEMLGYSQGYYGRLLNSIYELDEDDYEQLKEDWDGRFDDIVDFILYMEC